MTVELQDPTRRLQGHADAEAANLVSLAPVATLTWYTDPWSVWCFALEPAILCLRLTYGSQLAVRVVMGGIVEGGGAGGGAHPTRGPGRLDVRGVATIFETARGASQMPITTRGLFEDPPESTYPAGIAVCAVHLAEPAKAEAYLRRLRELALVAGVNVSRPEVQARAAADAGVAPEAFQEALASGEAEREFLQDLAHAEGRGIHAYPTLVFERPGSAPIALSGMHHFPVLKATLERYAEANMREFRPPGLPDMFRVRERLATREVAELLDVGIETAFEHLTRLERTQEVRRITLPGGNLWTRAR